MTARRPITEKGTPGPRPDVASNALVRPDWTRGELRDRRKLWLDKNENTDPEMAAVVATVLSEIPPDALFSYPETGPLYHKLAAHTGVAPENLLLSAGSDGAIRAVFEAYVEPGDVVVYTRPTFAMYGVYCSIYGADARPLDYRPSNAGPVLDCADIVAAIETEGPRLVCLPNPDSPTGTVYALPEMCRIVEAAAAAGAVMLVDEAYFPFHQETVLPWVLDYPNLVVTRSTGKAWGLAGFRIGYAAASAALARLLHKVRAMYETNTVAVAVFEAMLDHEAEMRASVDRLNAGKAYFLGEMERLGFEVLRGQGNFLHVNFGVRRDKVHAALADSVYYRQDFSEPCLNGFSRFSSTTPALFADVVRRIEDAIET